MIKLILPILLFQLSNAETNSINIGLNTKFHDSGFAAEFLEFTAKHHGNDGFWKYLNTLKSKLSNNQSPKEQYDTLFESLENMNFFSKPTLKVLGLTMGSRSLSARVHATSLIAENIKTDGDCKSFIQINDTFGTCVFTDTSEILSKSDEIGVTEPIPGEHVFNPASKSPLVILYGLPEDSKFFQLHDVMEKLAKDNHVKDTPR